MTMSRVWLWILAPALLSAGVLWLTAQDGKNAPQEGVRVSELAEKLQAREKVVLQKEAQLRELEQRLATLQVSLDRDRTDLQGREKALQEAQVKFDAERTRMVIDPQMLRTYEAMDPVSGAQALRELNQSNPEMAVGLLGAMAPKKAARVLEQVGQQDAKLMGVLLEKVGKTRTKV